MFPVFYLNALIYTAFPLFPASKKLDGSSGKFQVFYRTPFTSLRIFIGEKPVPIMIPQKYNKNALQIWIFPYN
jgi:hypothetical protein